MLGHRPLRWITVTAVAITAACAGVLASAPQPASARPSYEILDPAFLYRDYCQSKVGAFAPSRNAEGAPISRVYYGVRKGASYHLEVPLDWNGEVAIWAHGYNGEGPLLCAGAPALRDHWIRTGYAWAASSYRSNGYDVATGVRDSREVLRIFQRRVAKPKRVYLTGDSMGGHVTAVAIEKYRGVFDAAMPVCGVLGDTSLFDFFLDANVTAAALAGASTPPFPVEPGDYADYVKRQILPAFGRVDAAGALAPTTKAGQAWRAAVAQRSGGTRPGFASSFTFWNTVTDPATKAPFLFSVYPGSRVGTIGSAGAAVADNRETVYQLDNDPALTSSEGALNATVLRVEPAVNKASKEARARIPAVRGDPRIPVITLHTLGDLLVPFSMQQQYAERVATFGQGDLLTQRVIRGTLHCDFTPQELSTAFDDLVTAVRTGERPAGDDVLTRETVADPRYGCRFTRGPHRFFVSATCPAPR